jgi:DNA-binding NtrC family response regulator
MSTELAPWQSARELDLAAATDVPVMVTSPNAARRHAYARYIHDTGPRHWQPFVAASLDGIIASQALQAWFDSATGGTLFLDDLDRMADAVQDQLCATLCYPLETRRRSHEVRLITGSRPSWPSVSERRRFSDVLYYRLNVIRIDCGTSPLRKPVGGRDVRTPASPGVIENPTAAWRASRGR